MRKFILILLAFVSVNTFAQTAIETPKFFDNTYLNLNAGASTPLEFRLPLENVNPTVALHKETLLKQHMLVQMV